MTVVLDAGPIWLLTEVRPNPVAAACRRWLHDLGAAGRGIFVPEIADYEVRRELLRRGATTRLAELDRLIVPAAGSCAFLPITTPVMRRAAELWSLARQTGRPTAGDNTIDADMILVALAESLGAPGTVIATTNVGHLSQFFPAELWTNIVP